MTLSLLALLGCLPGAQDDDSGQDVTGLDGGTADGGGTGVACDLDQVDPADLPSVAGACREPELVTVVFHADGDTFVVDSSRGSETIRFIGVDTPETGYGSTDEECFGPEASEFTKAAFPLGSCLWLTFDQECVDPYDRTLAYLHTGTGEQDFFQRRLLHGGYASVLIYSPNDAFEDTFRDDEAAAQAAGAGLWGECGGNE
ncbi:thermonuclease family protein [Myxococcota bacterium]|nr:thermonuclease family protein [Myxococcota bacterium]